MWSFVLLLITPFSCEEENRFRPAARRSMGARTIESHGKITADASFLWQVPKRISHTLWLEMEKGYFEPQK